MENVVCFHLIFLYLFFLRAAPSAYRGSQARHPIGAVAAGLHHSHSNARSLTHRAQDLSHVFELHHSSQQCQILNPPSGARDPTCVLMVTSQMRFYCTTVGTPCIFFKRSTNESQVKYKISPNSYISHESL